MPATTPPPAPIHDPALYERLSQPRPLAEANTSLQAFHADVRRLRELHGIPDVLIVAAAFIEGVPGGDGCCAVSYSGDMVAVAPKLAAEAYRWGRRQWLDVFDRMAGVEPREGGEGE